MSNRNTPLHQAAMLELNGFWAAGDTMRQLYNANQDALHLLCTVLPFIEDAKDDPCYKDGVATSLLAKLRDTIQQLEALA